MDGAAAGSAIRLANLLLLFLLSSFGVTLSGSGLVSSPSRVVRSEPLRARAEWTERAATAGMAMAIGIGGATSGRAIATERARRDDTRAATLSTRLSMATAGESRSNNERTEKKHWRGQSGSRRIKRVLTRKRRPERSMHQRVFLGNKIGFCKYEPVWLCI